MEDRNVKSVDFEQGDLVQQLREKIRTQAQRLRNLEQYRLLCEQRINELYPGHNFPVKPEDLGTHQAPSNSQELLMAKQKIARLEQQLSQTNIKVPLTDNYTFPNPSTQLTLAQLQELYSAIYYQHYNVIKEKGLIEESLRAEMLNCEEQRAYIEVLKQALESNLQELGLTGRTIEDILNRKDRNPDEDSEVQNLTELLKAKTDEFNSLVEERTKSDKHLQEAAEALQYAEEEVQRLEEEKSALLDYIEEHSAKEKQMVFEMEKLRKDFGEYERKYQSLGKDYNNEVNSKREAEKELEDLKSDTSRQEKAYKDSYDHEIEKLKGHIKSIESKNESLQANNTTLSNTLKETQAELDTIKSQHDLSIKETSAIRRTLSISESKIEEIEKSSQQLKETKKDVETKLSKAEKELKNYKQNLAKELEAQYEKIQQQMNDELSELKGQLDLFEAKEKAANKENSELKKKLKKLQDESSKTSGLSQELLELKKSLDNAQVQIQQIMFEKDKLQSDLQKAEFSLNSEKTNNSLLEDESNNLREKLEESSKTLKQLISDNREKENRLQSFAFEIENLKKNLSISLKDTENERVLKTQYYEEVLKLKKMQNSLSASSFQIGESKKLINLFSSNFGAVSSASNSYHLIISNSFKDLLFKCNEPENIVISEWIQSACEELEALIRRLAEYKQDLTTVTQKLTGTQFKLDNISIDENALRDRERTLKTQIESLVSDKEKFLHDREIMLAKIQTSQAEISALRKDLQSSVDEGQRLRDQLNYTTSETIQWRNTAETDIFAIRAAEEKSNLLLKEKKELETLLSKLQSAVPSTDLQRVFLDIMKCHSELEVLNRERLRIENQLLRSEGEMRSHSRNHQQEKAIELRREVENLRTSLGNCDSQIMSYRRRMVSLEEELQDIEKYERRNADKGLWASLKKNPQVEDMEYGLLKKTPKYNPY